MKLTVDIWHNLADISSDKNASVHLNSTSSIRKSFDKFTPINNILYDSSLLLSWYANYLARLTAKNPCAAQALWESTIEMLAIIFFNFICKFNAHTIIIAWLWLASDATECNFMVSIILHLYFSNVCFFRCCCCLE